jgi:hypothetical protein
MILWMWKVRDCLYSKPITLCRLFGLWNFWNVYNSRQFTNFISLSILEAIQLESSDSLSHEDPVRFCYEHPTSSNSHLSSYHEIVVKSLSPAVGQLADCTSNQVRTQVACGGHVVRMLIEILGNCFFRASKTKAQSSHPGISHNGSWF